MFLNGTSGSDRHRGSSYPRSFFPSAAIHVQIHPEINMLAWEIRGPWCWASEITTAMQALGARAELQEGAAFQDSLSACCPITPSHVTCSRLCRGLVYTSILVQLGNKLSYSKAKHNQQTGQGQCQKHIADTFAKENSASPLQKTTVFFLASSCSKWRGKGRSLAETSIENRHCSFSRWKSP